MKVKIIYTTGIVVLLTLGKIYAMESRRKTTETSAATTHKSNQSDGVVGSCSGLPPAVMPPIKLIENNPAENKAIGDKLILSSEKASLTSAKKIQSNPKVVKRKKAGKKKSMQMNKKKHTFKLARKKTS